MKVIKKNAIRCKLCGDIIESNFLHDFKECSCGACACDGGHDYVKISGNPDDYEILTEYKDVKGYYVEDWTVYGGYHKYLTDKEPEQIIHILEDMWDCVRITDEDGNLIYQTKGLEKKIKKNESKYY